jgi:hypothetical protein
MSGTGIRMTSAAALGAIGVLASYKLKTAGTIGEPSFVVFVGLSAVVALALAFGDRLQSVSLRDLKIELAKVESSRKEVEQREQQVRHMATTLAEITIFFTAFHRRLGSDETHALEIQWLTQKVTTLLDGMAAPEKERQRVFHYLDAVQKMDAIKETDRESGKAQWEDLWKKIEDELHQPTKPAD